jgi:hypothetical protein
MPVKKPEVEDYLTKEQLREKLNLPSTRKIDYMMKAKMIPFHKWGAKTVRFDWEKVKVALDKFEHKAVGQK